MNDMTTPRPARTPGARPIAGLVLATVAVAAVVALWLVLAWTTGLIFHLLPGATFLAGGWTLRQVVGGRRVGWRDLAFVLGVGAVGTIGGAVLVMAAGRELDVAWVTGLVAVGGAIVTGIWLRRGASSGNDDRVAEATRS